MTTYDPSAARPGRVIFAAAIFIASVAAAGVAGWGWAVMWFPSQEQGAHSVAIPIGQSCATGLLIATGFALPYGWRTLSNILTLMLAQLGIMLVAVCAGLAVARESLPAPRSVVPPFLVVLAALGVALVLGAGLLRFSFRRRAQIREEIVETGRQVPGEISDVSQTGTVNGCPRWRVVARFEDMSGTPRWVTKHKTTWDPPQAGQQAAVYYDPARPGNQRRIVVSW